MADWPRRFDEFNARKERRAREAAIRPFTTDVDRRTNDFTAIGNGWSNALFDGPFLLSPLPPDQPCTNLVFVQSREGNTGTRNPSTLGGGAADKHLIYEGLSRVAADAVLAGAETVRGGDLVFSVWHPELVRLRAALGRPRHPIQMVATVHGFPFDRGLMFNVPDLQVILLTVPPCAELMRDALASRPWIKLLVMEDTKDLPEAFRGLRQLGIERVSAIGGRTLATALIDEGLIHDLYLTTTPISAGEPNTPMYSSALGSDLVLRKRGTGADAGVVFEHRVRLKPDATGTHPAKAGSHGNPSG